MKSLIRYKGLPAENNLTSIAESELIGWLIYLPETKEFFHSQKSIKSFSTTKEASLACCFGSERLAFRYSIFIDKSTEIVPLYKFGKKLVVFFNLSNSPGFPCQG